jgi:hypothetical protein
MSKRFNTLRMGKVPEYFRKILMYFNLEALSHCLEISLFKLESVNLYSNLVSVANEVAFIPSR